MRNCHVGVLIFGSNFDLEDPAFANDIYIRTHQQRSELIKTASPIDRFIISIYKSLVQGHSLLQSLDTSISENSGRMGSQPDYSLPTQEISFSGFLFDMDGTIIDSTPAVVKHWHK